MLRRKQLNSINISSWSYGFVLLTFFFISLAFAVLCFVVNINPIPSWKEFGNYSHPHHFIKRTSIPPLTQSFSSSRPNIHTYLYSAVPNGEFWYKLFRCRRKHRGCCFLRRVKLFQRGSDISDKNGLL